MKKPKCRNACDAVVYECHVRDFSADSSSGVVPEHRGKYVAFADKGTKYQGVNTCIEHLKELGITHVHLLPVEDYATVDESKPWLNQYNWGYDPRELSTALRGHILQTLMTLSAG